MKKKICELSDEDISDVTQEDVKRYEQSKG